MVPSKLLLLVVSVLVFAIFSGCVGDDGPAPVPEEDVGVVRDPADFSYLKNRSAPGSHVHDYWNGQDVRRVLADVGGCSGGCTVTYSGEDGAVVGSFRPPTDSIVPQGAAWLHINTSWSIEDGEYGDIALYVKTANMSRPQFVTKIENGMSVTINTTNEDNDPPHHRLSLWQFQVRALPEPGKSSTTLQNFEVQMVVDVERGLPIPLYPPHPDLWNGTTEIVLHESDRMVQYQLETPTLSACAGCLGRHAPDDGKIVPYDASHVEVVVEVQQGLPATLGLRYHGADTWDWSTAEPVEETPLRKVWRLDVEDRPDSPYAKQSLWDLYLVNDQPVDEAKAWLGTYHVTVTVVK